MSNFFFDNLNNKIKSNKFQIGVIGIGYVGIQLFINFCKKKINTIGFDRDLDKISKLKRGISPFSYIDNKKIKPLKKYGSYSSSFEDIKKCDVIIICLPTPVKKNTQPDLSVIENTIKKIKKFLKKGQLIILESTTYPGTTREKIAKELKKFKIGEDIFLSYSPERENPGSKMPFENVTKISSGYSNYCSALSGSVYRKIVKKVILANTLEEAEMTKLLENIYRSVNIGLVNELKIISKAMNININNVIKLASTKPFGFETFYPGPGIGGHCIPIDPYYLYWRAKKFGQTAKFIKLAGDINIETTSWTIKNITKILKKSKKKNKKNILILGLAYKKNIEDIRESAGVKILTQLRKKKHKVHFADPYVNYKDLEVKKIVGKTEQIKLNKKNILKYDCVILLTDHDKFDYKTITKYSKVLIDSRNKLSRKQNFYRL
jgi:UDP-N-acetyl-D-glucosamine dehydrogenase